MHHVEPGGGGGEVLRVFRTVGHHPHTVLEPVHGAIVDHQPVFVTERPVADLPDGKAEDVVGVHTLGRRESVGACGTPTC